jgi:tetratricopeptide (TPR) repeat protein
VLGHSFTAGGVTAVSGRPAEEVAGLLDGLIAKQLIAYNDVEYSPERGQYNFLQELLRTIAYSTLSRRDRKNKHLAAARFLQEGWGGEVGEIAEVLASHFLAAAEAEPEAPDAPKIRDSALQTLADAGRRAASLALGQEAQRAFDRATELAQDDRTRAELLEQAGRAAWVELDHEAARERLGAAIDLYERLDLPEAAARAQLVLSDIAAQVADVKEAVAIAEASRERLPADSRERAGAAAQLARWHMLAFEVDAALRFIDEALEIAEALEDWEVLAEALTTKGTTLYFAQRRQEGAALVQAGLRLARDHDLPLAEIRALNNLSSFMLAANRVEDALARIREAVELARARGDRQWQAWTAGDESLALMALGKWDEALEAGTRISEVGGELLSATLEVAIGRAMIFAARGQREELAVICERSRPHVESADGQSRAAARVTLGIAALNDGRPEETLELVGDLGEGNQSYDDRFGFFLVGQAALASGRYDELERRTKAVLDGPPAASGPLSRALAQVLRGALASRRDEHSEAVAALDAGIAGIRELNHPFELAWALLERGRAQARAGSAAEAAESLDQAREIYVRLRAETWVSEVDNAIEPSADSATASL